ncbi:hypothetical protein LTS17_001464 [Exophiala oligosperma]
MHRTLISHALRQKCPVLAIRRSPTLRCYRARPFKAKGPSAWRRPDHGLTQPGEPVAEQHEVLRGKKKEEEALKVTESGDACFAWASKSTASLESTVPEPRQSSSSSETPSPSAREGRQHALSGKHGNGGDLLDTDPLKSIAEGVDADADGDDRDLTAELKLKRLDAKPAQFRPLLREVRRIGKVIGRDRNGLNRLVDRKDVSTQVLEDELKWIAKTTPQPKLTREILNILIADRKIKPRPDLYEALILSNCSPEYGSADNVRATLEEMEREGIAMNPSVYYAALTALTVHPDTYLRTGILQRLAQQWVTIPPLYVKLNIVAMIREGQLELATVELENLQREEDGGGGHIDAWVWTIYMHALCDHHAFEDLLQLCYKLYDSNFPFPRHTLLHVLRIASRYSARNQKDADAAAASVTRWVWYTYVENMHVIPDKGLCLNVLTIAARTRDVDLAESAAVVLENAAAGKKTTVPNSLAPWEKNDSTVSLESPELPDWEESETSSSSSSSAEREKHRRDGRATILTNRDDVGATVNEPRAAAFSTPPDLPSQPLPPRQLSRQALDLLRLAREGAGAGDALGSESDTDVVRSSGSPRPRNNPAVLYKFFREESGLRGARFDPLLALQEGWKWRKK